MNIENRKTTPDLIHSRRGPEIVFYSLGKPQFFMSSAIGRFFEPGTKVDFNVTADQDDVIISVSPGTQFSLVGRPGKPNYKRLCGSCVGLLEILQKYELKYPIRLRMLQTVDDKWVGTLKRQVC